MAKPHNARFAAARRRVLVSEMYLQGCTQPEIAARLRVSQATVSRDLRAIQNEWRAAGIRNLEVIRARELQKLELVEREAWAAWQRSQQPATTTKGRPNSSRSGRNDGVGDPRFLDQVNRCIVQRRTLLGLDAPLQVADVTPLLADSLEQRRPRHFPPPAFSKIRRMTDG